MLQEIITTELQEMQLSNEELEVMLSEELALGCGAIVFCGGASCSGPA